MNYQPGDFVYLLSSFFQNYWPGTPQLYDIYYCTPWIVCEKRLRIADCEYRLAHSENNNLNQLWVAEQHFRLMGANDSAVDPLVRVKLKDYARITVPDLYSGDIVGWDLREIGAWQISKGIVDAPLNLCWPVTLKEAVDLCQARFTVLKVHPTRCIASLISEDNLFRFDDVPTTLLVKT